MKSLIIDARQCRSRSQRALDIALTTILWGIYLYLSREALLFLAMLADWLVDPEGAWLLHRFAAILPTLVLYSQVAAANSLALFAWALANQLRFQGRERRRGLTNVGVPELARFHHVSEHDVAQWLNARRLVIHHDEMGNIDYVETGFSLRPKIHAVA